MICHRFAICFFTFAFCLPAALDAQRTRGQDSDSDDQISFVNDVAPIINAKCGRCHVASSKGRYGIKSYKALMNSDSITPDDPGDSYFIEVIENGDMPKGGLKVERGELKILKQWISEGARFDGVNESQAVNTMGSDRGTRDGQTSGSRTRGRRTSRSRSRRTSKPSPFDANKLLAFLDKNGDGKLSLSEIDAASRMLYSLDSNEDDRITPDEVEEFSGN